MARAVLLSLFLLSLASANEWDYGTNWTADFASCGGQSQSPIDLDADTASPADFRSFNFDMGYRMLQTGSLTNNGHNLEFSVGEESVKASVSGGPLSVPYILNSFKLHWGSMSGQGSEHTINGRSYDGELQLVHYSSKFEDLAAAVASGESNALAVVAILLDEGTAWDQHRGAQAFESIQTLKMAANKLSRPWRGPSSPEVDMEIVLEQLMGSLSDLTGMYHYTGSTTTPDCNEIVMWLVMDTPMHIRDHGLMEALRKNLDVQGNSLQDNYRPTQELNDRKVYYYTGTSGPFPYYVFVPNAYNCSSACECITSPEECLMAANQVGEFHPIEEETEDEYPPGCYVGAGGEDLRFNWNFTNTYSYNYSAYPYYDYSMLCIEEPDQPNYHGYDLVINDRTPCVHISLEECQLVAEKLGLEDDVTGGIIFENSTSYPPNCYVFYGDLVFFNNATVPANTYDCNHVEQCVCHRN